MNGWATASSTSLAAKRTSAATRSVRQPKPAGSAIGFVAAGEIEPVDVELFATDHHGQGHERRDAGKVRSDIAAHRPPVVVEQQRILAGVRLGVEPVVELV